VPALIGRHPHRWSRPWLPAVAAGLAVLVTACADTGSGPASSTPTPSRDICAGTQPGGQVVVYSSYGLEYWYADVLSNFQGDCNVAIYYAGLPNTQVAPRLEGEATSPLADIVIAPAPYITEAADKGLLDGTDVPGASSIPADRCDAKRRWCTVLESYESFVYNPTHASPPPSSWQDLLAARFHAQVLTSRVDQAVDGLALVALLENTMGVDGAFAYLHQLETNVSAHYVVSDTMSRVVGAGGALAANGDLQESLNDLIQYHNLAIWFPTVGGSPRTTVAIPFGAALVHGGQNRANARALLAYMWSDAAQSLVAQAYGAPARPGVHQRSLRAPQVAAALAGVRILRIDWEQLYRQEAALTARWLALRTAPDGTVVPATPVPQPSLSPPP
jgi:2-aminoethylphosphonate transport system substrate-binding protein